MRPARAPVVVAAALVPPITLLLAWLFLFPAGPPHDASPARLGKPAPPAHAFTPATPPPLLPPRVATPDAPSLSSERLLAADGSPAEDLAALADLVTGYLQSGLGDARPTIGFNEDLIPALTDQATLGDAALSPDHPAIRDGRLLDRWGTPWQVHPLAGDLIQLRSAGPDRLLYTADDLVAPEANPSNASEESW